jgi:hypothetical protein
VEQQYGRAPPTAEEVKSREALPVVDPDYPVVEAAVWLNIVQPDRDASTSRVRQLSKRLTGQPPAVQLLGLTEAQKRALALDDNKIGDNAGWDGERLAIELPDLAELLFKEKLDVSLTGFRPAEIDQLLIERSNELLSSVTRPCRTGVRAMRQQSEVQTRLLSFTYRR